MLTPDELAYMRETQEDAQPLAAVLRSPTSTSDGMGGTTESDGEPQEVTVRIGRQQSRQAPLPQNLAARYGADLLTATLPNGTQVSTGASITVSADEVYVAVSNAMGGRWSTAVQVYVIRDGIG